MKVIKGKKFTQETIDNAYRVDGEDYGECCLCYEPVSGYVSIENGHEKREYAALEDFFEDAASMDIDVEALLGDIDEGRPECLEVADRWCDFYQSTHKTI